MPNLPISPANASSTDEATSIDPLILSRAEAAIAALSVNFDQWLEVDIAKLELALTDHLYQPASADIRDGLYRRSHDLKGLGTTYEFPLISRIALSLCIWLETPRSRAPLGKALITAHVTAIRHAKNQGLRSDQDPRGRQLAETLEAQVRS